MFDLNALSSYHCISIHQGYDLEIDYVLNKYSLFGLQGDDIVSVVCFEYFGIIKWKLKTAMDETDRS